jgi:hypothetical protein
MDLIHFALPPSRYGLRLAHPAWKFFTFPRRSVVAAPISPSKSLCNCICQPETLPVALKILNAKALTYRR